MNTQKKARKFFCGPYKGKNVMNKVDEISNVSTDTTRLTIGTIWLIIGAIWFIANLYLVLYFRDPLVPLLVVTANAIVVTFVYFWFLSRIDASH